MTHEQAAIVVVTADLAREWLSRNTHNRRVNETYVSTLAEAMTRGEFQFNGDAIRLSATGTLLDGQHRLCAVVRTGIAIRQVVVRGLAVDAQVTMDRQHKRTLGHHLDIMGEARTKYVTAAINLAWQWDQDVRWAIGASAAPKPTYEQAYEFLLTHPELRYSAEETKSMVTKKIMRRSTGALLHWVFNQIDPEACADFFDRMASGVHIDEGDPVFAMRERAKTLRADKQETATLIVPLACKAWNLYREGKTVKALRIRVGGTRDMFPEPR